MVKITTPFVLAGIGLALIVIFMSISRFGIPTINKLGESLGSAFSGASTGIADFFNSFEPQSALATSEETKDDPFFEKTEESRGSPQDLIDDLDPDSPTFEQDKLDVLEKLGITGADSVEVTEGGGLKITSNIDNGRDKSLDNDPIDLFKAFGDFFANLLPSAFGDTGQQTRNEEPDQQQTTEPKTVQQTGIVRSELVPTEKEEIQQFKVFGSNVDNRAIRGVIRQTPKNELKLKTTSRNRPIESASERASRTFEDLGKFQGEERNERVTKAAKRNKFNFGTNTGSGLKISTVNRGGESKSTKSESSKAARRKEVLRLAAERARNSFDSRGIQNF